MRAIKETYGGTSLRLRITVLVAIEICEPFQNRASESSFYHTQCPELLTPATDAKILRSTWKDTIDTSLTVRQTWAQIWALQLPGYQTMVQLYS